MLPLFSVILGCILIFTNSHVTIIESEIEGGDGEAVITFNNGEKETTENFEPGDHDNKITIEKPNSNEKIEYHFTLRRIWEGPKLKKFCDDMASYLNNDIIDKGGNVWINDEPVAKPATVVAVDQQPVSSFMEYTNNLETLQNEYQIAYEKGFRIGYQRALHESLQMHSLNEDIDRKPYHKANEHY